jgi:hypothetical protein
MDQWLSDSEGWKEWNRGPHKRKFLCADGLITRRPKEHPIRRTFTFWGEWEPPSRVRAIPQISDGYPKWRHTPELNLEAKKTVNSNLLCDDMNFQNTDPLVFGDRFLYVVCQQIKNGRLTTLSRLNTGDIILFGSCVCGRKMFAVDTVFVVGIHEMVHHVDKLPDWESDLHNIITTDLIDIPKCGLRFYGGETWSSEGPFSFVPCLPTTLDGEGFRRPVIQPSGILSGIITPTLSQGHKITTFDDDKYALAVFDAVVGQVINQGCCLATTIDEPIWHARKWIGGVPQGSCRRAGCHDDPHQDAGCRLRDFPGTRRIRAEARQRTQRHGADER